MKLQHPATDHIGRVARVCVAVSDKSDKFMMEWFVDWILKRLMDIQYLTKLLNAR